ncbi:MAG: hypothetical protein Q8O33_04175 [Pseudomonadota bacterium]|nr:hypothetical protein [Pseudomonadota bacterium]
MNPIDLAMPASIRRINLFGCRRSGTNYLGALLVRNLDVRLTPEAFSFKHDPPTPRLLAQLAGDKGRDLLCLICVRHPATWMVSRLIWARENPASGPADAGFLCRRYNDRYRTWFDLVARHPEHAAWVRYEDLLDDPAACLAGLRRCFPLPARGPDFVAVETRVETGRRVTRAPFDRAAHALDRYLARLAPADIQRIRADIDWKRLASLGYRAEDM